MAIWWQRRFARLILAPLGLGFFMFGAEAVFSPPALASAGGQLYWSDVQTGYAIGGYDPVAYFVDAEPRLGSKGFEFDWQGVTWRFVSAANRAVFVRDPKVYAPQFGGYGAEGVAQGVLSEGSPHNWLIYEDRLFLFISAGQRAKWRNETGYRRGRANGNWPKINGGLVRG